jgi:hypothetical protein
MHDHNKKSNIFKTKELVTGAGVGARTVSSYSGALPTRSWCHNTTFGS